MKRLTIILALLTLTGCVSWLPHRDKLPKSDSYPPDIAVQCQQANDAAHQAVESVLGRKVVKGYGWGVKRHAAEGRNDEGLWYWVHPQLGRVGGTTLLGCSEVVCEPDGTVQRFNLLAEAVHYWLIQANGNASRDGEYMVCLRMAVECGGVK